MLFELSECCQCLYVATLECQQSLIHQPRGPFCYTAYVCPLTYLATHESCLQRQRLLAGISG